MVYVVSDSNARPSPKRRQRGAWRLITLVFVLLACGCEGPAASLLTAPDEAAVSSEAPVESEIAYLATETTLDEFDFEGGALGAPVMVRPSHAFRGVSVMLTTPVPELYFRTDLDDVWIRLQPSVSEGDLFHAGYVSLYGPADWIEFWSPSPLAFGRLEFHETPTDAPWVLDDEPGNADLTAPDPQAVHGEKGVQRQALSKPGRWQLSGDARRAGERSHVHYDPPPSWAGGRNCSGGLQPGAAALGKFLVRNFDGARYFGGYACRRVRGGSGTSVHAVGRAIDVFVPLHAGAADNDLGDEIAHYLVENAEELGVQLIIWDRTLWNASYSGRKDKYYAGDHPHHDHLHVELTREAARGGGDYSQPAAAAPVVFDPPFADDDDNTHVRAIEAIYEAGITTGCDKNPLRYCPRREVSRANAAVMLQRTLNLASVHEDYFSDDDGLSAESAINALAARGIVEGCDADQGKYCPSNSLTRGALAVMLNRALELPSTSDDYFTDDDGQFYEAAANRIAAAGLTNGCGDKQFCGNQPVHRDEMASFIARAAGLIGGFDAQPLSYRGHFADDDGHLFEGDIDAIASAGIVNGCAQGETPRYCPDDPATRAQMATVLVRAFDIPPSGVDAFDDDDGSSHEDAINAIAAAGITVGCADRKFCPGRSVTRGEAAVFLNRADGFAATSNDFFDDDDGKFYENAANRMAAAGVTNGCGDRRFCGDRATTRGELAAFLRRTLGL